MTRGIRRCLQVLLVLLVVSCALGSVGAAAVGGAAASTTNVAQPVAGLQDEGSGDGNVSRRGGELLVSVPAAAIGDAGNATTLAVAAPAANGSTTVDARRANEDYVARVPLTDVVGANASADLSATTVSVRHGNAVVLQHVVDLRYVAQTDPATFRGGTLVVPADVRGVGDGELTLDSTEEARRLNATVAGIGPNATILVEPGELAGLDPNATVETHATVDDATISPAPIVFSVGEAAARGTTIAYRGEDPVVIQPLAHPDLGPERIELTVATEGPRGFYHVRTAGPEPAVPIPASVVGAREVTVRVERGAGSAVGSDGSSGRGPIVEVGVAAPSRATVPLRIANGSLHAPDPPALESFDGLLLRDENVSYVPIESALRTDGEQPLPATVASPSQDATAILVGSGARPARVDLTVVPPPSPPESDSSPSDTEGDAFVGLWLDIGSIVGLLLVAMVGSVLSVGAVYGLRRISPARAAAAGPRAVAGHFCFGAVGGVLAIAAVQSQLSGPVLGTVNVAGAELGLGALLVGTFHGGLTATGLRLGLGTVEAWPTRRVVDETAVPVRVRFTDDEGESLPGEQTVAVRHVPDGSVVERTTLAGTTTEVELPAGEYSIVGRTAERASDAVEIAIEEPTRPRPEARPVHLTVGRPGFQLELTDAETGDPIPEGDVTITTDREQTKAAAIEDGSVATTLPVGTGSVSAVLRAAGYDEQTVETPIEAELTTVDVAMDPAAGTLLVSAQVAGEPIEDAAVTVEPADDADEDGRHSDAASGDPRSGTGDGAPADGVDPVPDVGVRTDEATTDETGTARIELPAGRYRASLVLDGPNADLFTATDGLASVAPDEETPVAVEAAFDWVPEERVGHRAAGLRSTIRSVAEEATADPTIPLYFAAATEALLDCLDELPASGHQFATSELDPDEVAAATVAAAEAALEAVGQAMQAEGVREVMARSDREPVRIEPELDATPGALLAYLERDLTIASVDARAHEVEQVIESEADRLRSVAPARVVVEKAVALVGDGEPSTHSAAREFAALLLLDAVEQAFVTDAVRSRLE